MEFFKTFPQTVYAGDSFNVPYGALRIRATIVPDYSTNPRDFDCYSPEQVAAFDAGDWQYVGVVLSIHLDDITLDDHAASLWGVDFDPSAGNVGGHLADTANDLLSEATDRAEKLMQIIREKLSAAA